MGELTKEQANALLAEKLAQASSLISECEALADQYGLYFSSPVGEYGMGGTYYGEGNEWEASAGWSASSQSC